jgi:hypothetical protein
LVDDLPAAVANVAIPKAGYCVDVLVVLVVPHQRAFAPSDGDELFGRSTRASERMEKWASRHDDLE